MKRGLYILFIHCTCDVAQTCYEVERDQF